MTDYTKNPFTEKRKEGDIDLVESISQMLKDANYQDPNNWIKDPIIELAINEAPRLQRFLINRYWRLVLGKCSENTSRQRYCLTQEGSDELYLEIFKNSVLPFIIKHNL